MAPNSIVETIDKLDKMNGRGWAQICFASMFKHWHSHSHHREPRTYVVPCVESCANSGERE